MKLPNLLYRTTLLKFNNVHSNPTADYNKVANSYDDYYSKNLCLGANELLENLPIEKDSTILDLACGTGFFTHPVAQAVGPQGKVIAVDVSSGMLDQNEKNARIKELTNITFSQIDALSALAELEDFSIDGIVCGWGICYIDHAKFAREIERVIRPGGFVGIIENRACTLKEVSDLFTEVLLDYPKALVKNMIIHLPKDKKYLVNKFCKGTFQIDSAWEGKVTVPCESGQDILDYIVKSGASAGFIDALDSTLLSKVLQSFKHHADQRFSKGIVTRVVHEYCALVALKK